MLDLKEAFTKLTNMTERERQNIYDTGYFNTITSAYCYGAMKEAELTQEQIDAVLFNIKILHDNTSASQMLEDYKK